MNLTTIGIPTADICRIKLTLVNNHFMNHPLLKYILILYNKSKCRNSLDFPNNILHNAVGMVFWLWQITDFYEQLNSKHHRVIQWLEMSVLPCLKQAITKREMENIYKMGESEFNNSRTINALIISVLCIIIQ